MIFFPFFIDLKTYLKTIQKSVPTAEDVDGASNAILRLQETYKLDAKSFIRLASLHSMVLLPMTLDEVYKIGRTAYSRSKMQLTKDWMRLALDMLESGVVGYIDEKENGGVNYQIDIRDHLAYANFRVSLEYNFLFFQKPGVQEKGVQIWLRLVIKM